MFNISSKSIKPSNKIMKISEIETEIEILQK